MEEKDIFWVEQINKKIDQIPEYRKYVSKLLNKKKYTLSDLSHKFYDPLQVQHNKVIGGKNSFDATGASRANRGFFLSRTDHNINDISKMVNQINSECKNLVLNLNNNTNQQKMIKEVKNFSSKLNAKTNTLNDEIKNLAHGIAADNNNIINFFNLFYSSHAMLGNSNQLFCNKD